MKLFLASEAKHPESLERLTEFMGGSLKGLKIAYIPTAANGESYGGWKVGGSIQLVHSIGAKVTVVELEDQGYKDVIKEIKGNDILWMAGGMTGYLMYWLRRTELDKAIPEILDSGTVYVGSSAGSMVCARTMKAADCFVGDEEPGASIFPGLGLIDFEIYPHYEESLLPELKKRWTGGKLYLLKNGEVITKVGNKIEILGEERFIE